MSRGWSGAGWHVAVTATEVEVGDPSRVVTIASSGASKLHVKRRWFRWSLWDGDLPLLRLHGIARRDAAALSHELARLALVSPIAEAVAWHAAVSRRIVAGRSEQRWIPTEEAQALAAARPPPHLADRVRAAGCEARLNAEERDAVAFADADLSLVAATNEQIMAAELSSRRLFFDTIEKTPLTDEQARAVVCFDNRVQVLAAAGSGKTSVMVARAAYAVSRGFVPPERILLLAFNRAAAAELQERVTARFAAAGIDSSGVRASTFHAFGLDVIGRATAEKPRLASWVEGGEDVQMVLRIVDVLRESSGSFRYRWDVYRLLFANAPTNLEAQFSGPCHRGQRRSKSPVSDIKVLDHSSGRRTRNLPGSTTTLQLARSSSGPRYKRLRREAATRSGRWSGSLSTMMPG